MSLDKMYEHRIEVMVEQYKLLLEYRYYIEQFEPSTPVEQYRKESRAEELERMAEDLPFVEVSLDLDGGDAE